MTESELDDEVRRSLFLLRKRLGDDHETVRETVVDTLQKLHRRYRRLHELVADSFLSGLTDEELWGGLESEEDAAP